MILHDCLHGLGLEADLSRWLVLLVAYVAHTAYMPCGLDVLLVLIYFQSKSLSKENSGSNGPIFTKFSPHGRYFDRRLPI